MKEIRGLGGCFAECRESRKESWLKIQQMQMKWL